jgi:hypothetical protein
MTSLILYSTIIGGFYEQSEALDQALAAAKKIVGEDVWKKGYSAKEPKGATAAAKEQIELAKIHPAEIKGELDYIKFTENKDQSGNLYPKLRIGMRNSEGKNLLLSLDLKGDVAQRLLVKLYKAKQGDYLTIVAWPTQVTKADRVFVNHAVSVKDSQGVEIPVNPTFSTELKQKTEALETSLRAAGVEDKDIIAKAKTKKRMTEHKDLLLKMEAEFSENIPS